MLLLAHRSFASLCTLLTAVPLLIPPTAALFAQPAESLSTSAIPMMGINDVMEGTLLLKTYQVDLYTPNPMHFRYRRDS